MIEMRSHAVWYFKYLKNSKPFRLRLVNISKMDELKQICDEYLKENG